MSIRKIKTKRKRRLRPPRGHLTNKPDGISGRIKKDVTYTKGLK